MCERSTDAVGLASDSPSKLCSIIDVNRDGWKQTVFIVKERKMSFKIIIND